LKEHALHSDFKYKHMKKYKYLKKHRLTDILSLLQLLALHNNQYLSIDEIKKSIGSPDSSSNWDEIADNYAEFFFFNKSDKSISLAIRKLSPQKLSIAQTFDLINTATTLHDKEILRRNRNAHFIPLAIAFLTITFSAFSLIYSSFNLEKSLRKIIKEELHSTEQRDSTTNNIITHQNK